MRVNNCAKGGVRMKKLLWIVAVMALFCGTAFAIGNATGTEQSQSGWTNTNQSAVSIAIEGGNISNVDLSTNTSTARWAGAYGNITGNIILGESGETSFMYTWSVSNADLGEVCVSQDSAPTWANFAATTGAEVDTVFGFSTGDDQAVDFFTDTSVVLTVSGTTPITTTGATTLGSWEFGAAEFTGSPAAEADFAFCANISQQATDYKGHAVDFELMFPTTTGAVDTYYFYLELE
jgi:hypothetical protein